jgi:hypothetical protein
MRNQINKLNLHSVIPPHRVSHIKQIIQTEWNVPVAVRDSCLLHHFILYWETSHLLAQLDDNSGAIYKDGRLFKVIFHKCTLADCIAASGQVALSFRVPKHSYNLMPTVLISASSAHTRARKTQS